MKTKEIERTYLATDGSEWTISNIPMCQWPLGWYYVDGDGQCRSANSFANAVECIEDEIDAA